MSDRPSDGRTREAIGERLRLTREALGLQQNEFAERAGLTANAYNQYETAKNFPNLDAAHALCDGHQLTLDWIFRGDQSGLRYRLAEDIKRARSNDVKIKRPGRPRSVKKPTPEAQGH